MLSKLRPYQQGRSNWHDARISQAKKSGGCKFWTGLKNSLQVQAAVKERFVKAASDMEPTWTMPLKSERADCCNLQKKFHTIETSANRDNMHESAKNKIVTSGKT